MTRTETRRRLRRYGVSRSGATDLTDGDAEFLLRQLESVDDTTRAMLIRMRRQANQGCGFPNGWKTGGVRKRNIPPAVNLNAPLIRGRALHEWMADFAVSDMGWIRGEIQRQHSARLTPPAPKPVARERGGDVERMLSLAARLEGKNATAA